MIPSEDLKGLALPRQEFALPNGLTVRIPSLKVEHGGLLILVGPNGGGKTSLANFLCGLRLQKPHFSSDQDCPVLVWQSPELFPGTVEQNVRIVTRGTKGSWAIPSAATGDPVNKALSFFELFAKRGARVDTLSGGETQKINLVRGFLASTDGIVLDEPNASLDYQTNEKLVLCIERYLRPLEPSRGSDDVDWLRDVPAKARYVICITHDRTLIDKLAYLNPRFASIDMGASETINGKKFVTLDADESGQGYDLKFVRSGNFLFWAEFFGLPNVFYVHPSTTKVVALDQLNRIEPGEKYVIIPSTSFKLVADVHENARVKVREIEDKPHGKEYLVDFTGKNGKSAPIWVAQSGRTDILVDKGMECGLQLTKSYDAQPQSRRYDSFIRP